MNCSAWDGKKCTRFNSDCPHPDCPWPHIQKKFLKANEEKDVE
ncbi:unnamed protein product [marine sediment metagenome]|uniref:Uncharacterized protein n=1 Tax=marine sediment metagenome TaxID=412755 RepID=X1DIE2_9ZZZZ